MRVCKMVMGLCNSFTLMVDVEFWV
jgi:hypothetical protein